ncbi:shikimate kinase [Paenibacillus sp. 1_12]|uniref:AAA family ATPase n=1 Tax=Paenibacillus sp. 1_12 TaxID=1566278 RepID=UPI0008E5DC57|nr:shikimate kinase [Paenibacillus sp. 1_12]SFL82894.1 shikimate kinase [Paenibacillus sp. 1_12]
MRKLVFFLGPAGAGKTTIAKTLAKRYRAALFDMDTMLRPAAAALMKLAGLDPEDRDSATYKSLCRDLGYRITMDAALENIELGTDAYVIGPFTKETESPEWLVKELESIGASVENVEVKVVFVHLADSLSYYQRIKERGLSLDDWKLDNWNVFSQTLAIRDIHWDIPISHIFYYNNSVPSVPITDDSFMSVERFIYGSSSLNAERNEE